MNLFNERNIAYKVVRVKANGARVSAAIPNWNPLYKVYMSNGKFKVVDSGMVFKDKFDAMSWTYNFGKVSRKAYFWHELNPKEKLEVWKVEYQNRINEDKIINPKILFSKVNCNAFKDIFLQKINKSFPEMMENAKEKAEENHFDKYIGSLSKYWLFVSNIQLVERLVF